MLGCIRAVIEDRAPVTIPLIRVSKDHFLLLRDDLGIPEPFECGIQGVDMDTDFLDGGVIRIVLRCVVVDRLAR